MSINMDTISRQSLKGLRLRITSNFNIKNVSLLAGFMLLLIFIQFKSIIVVTDTLNHSKMVHSQS